MSDKNSVLFVCLGNICRSPIAEAVFLHLIRERNIQKAWTVDSGAIGPWHVGNPPDRRALKVISDNTIEYSHRARQITKDDFTKFDYIFGMDEENMEDLKRKCPKNSTARVEMLGSLHPNGPVIIEDPYYQKGDEGFKKCFTQCVESCTAFLDGLST